jgi:hypothetical protein
MDYHYEVKEISRGIISRSKRLSFMSTAPRIHHPHVKMLAHRTPVQSESQIHFVMLHLFSCGQCTPSDATVLQMISGHIEIVAWNADRKRVSERRSISVVGDVKQFHSRWTRMRFSEGETWSRGDANTVEQFCLNKSRIQAKGDFRETSSDKCEINECSEGWAEKSRIRSWCVPRAAAT